MPTSHRTHRGHGAAQRGATGARVAVTIVVGIVALTAGCSADNVPVRVDHVSTATAGAPTAGTLPGAGSSASAGPPASGTGSSGTMRPGAGPTGTGPAGTGAAGTGAPRAGAAGTTGLGSEVPSQAGPTRAPLAVAADVPRLTAPLPSTASARGSLVTGFPITIVPVPDGATVASSSVSAEGVRLQVGLEASTGAKPADVLARYVQALTAAGFAVVSSPAVPGSSATAFVRGNDGLVLTLRPRLSGGTELSVAGTLTVGA